MKLYRLLKYLHDNGSGAETIRRTDTVLDFDTLSKREELVYYNDEHGEYFGSAAQPSSIAGCVVWTEWHREDN